MSLNIAFFILILYLYIFQLGKGQRLAECKL